MDFEWNPFNGFHIRNNDDTCNIHCKLIAYNVRNAVVWSPKCKLCNGSAKR